MNFTDSYSRCLLFQIPTTVIACPLLDLINKGRREACIAVYFGMTHFKSLSLFPSNYCKLGCISAVLMLSPCLALLFCVPLTWTSSYLAWNLLLKFTIQMVNRNKVASEMFLLTLPTLAHITHALNCYGLQRAVCLIFFTALIKRQIKLLTTCARMSARMDTIKMFSSVLILCLWGVSCL